MEAVQRHRRHKIQSCCSMLNRPAARMGPRRGGPAFRSSRLDDPMGRGDPHDWGELKWCCCRRCLLVLPGAGGRQRHPGSRRSWERADEGWRVLEKASGSGVDRFLLLVRGESGFGCWAGRGRAGGSLPLAYGGAPVAFREGRVPVFWQRINVVPSRASVCGGPARRGRAHGTRWGGLGPPVVRPGTGKGFAEGVRPGWGWLRTRP